METAVPMPKIETKLINTETISQRIGKKLRELCTVDGRAEKIMADQYSKVLEQLPPDTSMAERARLEQMLQERSRSVATGALVTDALVTGAVVVTGGLIGRQVFKEVGDISKYVKFARKNADKIQKLGGINKIDTKTRMGKKLLALKSQMLANPLTRATVTVGRPTIDVTKWGAKHAWNVVTFPFWGTYKVLELLGIPYAIKETGNAVAHVVGELKK